MELPRGEHDDPETAKQAGNPEENRGSALRNVGLLFGSGTQLAISVAVMFFLGRWADEKLHTAPWLLIGGVLVGVGAGLASFIRTAMSLDDRAKQNDHPAK